MTCGKMVVDDKKAIFPIPTQTSLSCRIFWHHFQFASFQRFSQSPHQPVRIKPGERTIPLSHRPPLSPSSPSKKLSSVLSPCILFLIYFATPRNFPKDSLFPQRPTFWLPHKRPHPHLPHKNPQLVTEWADLLCDQAGLNGSTRPRPLFHKGEGGSRAVLVD